jgi:hypothetical protein
MAVDLIATEEPNLVQQSLSSLLRLITGIARPADLNKQLFVL